MKRHLLLVILLAPLVLLAQENDGDRVHCTGLDNEDEDAKPDGTPDFIYTVVEQMPEFPGGEHAMFTFLAKNTRYPTCLEEEATAFVSFVVERDGSLSNVNMLRGVAPVVDQEALRVIKAMPPWKPGRMNGEAVPVRYNLPIRFSLR